MKLIGIDLKFAQEPDPVWLAACGAGGAAVGAFLRHLTQGPAAVPAAMAAAGVCAGVLAAAGANLDAGWRGAVIALGGAIGAFLITSAVL